jgi:hypothetical protein
MSKKFWPNIWNSAAYSTVPPAETPHTWNSQKTRETLNVRFRTPYIYHIPCVVPGCITLSVQWALSVSPGPTSSLANQRPAALYHWHGPSYDKSRLHPCSLRFFVVQPVARLGVLRLHSTGAAHWGPHSATLAGSLGRQHEGKSLSISTNCFEPLGSN